MNVRNLALKFCMGERMLNDLEVFSGVDVINLPSFRLSTFNKTCPECLGKLFSSSRRRLRRSKPETSLDKFRRARLYLLLRHLLRL